MATRKITQKEITGTVISMKMAKNWGYHITVNKSTLTATVRHVFPAQTLSPAITVLYLNSKGEIWTQITLLPGNAKRSVIVGNAHK